MQIDMSKIIYNEYVMGERDYYEDIEEDIVVYDDSEEWYNLEYDGE